MFATFSHLHPSLVFESKAGAYRVGLTPYGWLSALSPIISKGWKGLTLANSLAYYNTPKISVFRKSYRTEPWIQTLDIRIKTPWSCIIKFITAVINGFLSKQGCFFLNTRLG